MEARIGARVIRRPLQLEAKFYIVVLKSTILYGTECYPVKSSHVQMTRVTQNAEGNMSTY